MLQKRVRNGGLGCTRCCVVAALSAVAIGSADLQSARAAAPQQAVIFRGSRGAGDTFIVSLSEIGVQIDLGAPFSCPTTSHNSPGGFTVVGPPGAGVYTSASGLSLELSNFLSSQPQLPAVSLEALNDDCDVAVNFTTAMNEMARAVADAQSQFEAIETCRDQARLTYCIVIAAIEAIPSSGPGGELTWGDKSLHAIKLGLLDPLNDPVPTCDPFLGRLLNLVPVLMDGIAAGIASCDAAHAQLLFQSGALPVEILEEARDDELAFADHLLAKAELSLTRAQERLSRIQVIQSEMTLAAVQSSCLDCPGSGSFGPSRAISLTATKSVLELLVTAFEAAAVTAPEPDDAVRFQAIADQMEGILEARVLQFTYPSGTLVGNHYVALASVDDGFSPLAVVLSAEAGGPPVNTMDLRIFLDSLHAFHDALNDMVKPDDADDDDDRVRDVYETDTGTPVSRTDTGTDPTRPDTDGDLYFDGTEIASGANPNDPNSVPEPVVVPIPAVTQWGMGLLGLLLVAGALVVPKRLR